MRAWISRRITDPFGDLGTPAHDNEPDTPEMERIPDNGEKTTPSRPAVQGASARPRPAGPSAADKRERFVSRAKIVVFVLAGLPFVALLVRGFLGDLGANPVEEITHVTGEWTLRLLILTLAITPLRHLTGTVWPTRLRRMLGLYAFFYLLLHFMTYSILDASLDPAYIARDVVDRLYITAGFAAFSMLVPLAITSTNAMVRRLGPLRWRRLHRLVYLASIGGVLHFLWLATAKIDLRDPLLWLAQPDLRDPLIYASIFAVLLAMRLPPLTRRIQAIGNRRKTRSIASKTRP